MAQENAVSAQDTQAQPATGAPAQNQVGANDESNTVKDPDEWTTGSEPMTGAQKSYLKTLSDEAKQPFDENLTKAEASKRIDELQQITGRGNSDWRNAAR